MVDDPGSRDASIWIDGYWQKTSAPHLRAVGLAAYLDLDWLWSQLGKS